MKRALIVCLALATLLVFDSSAEAGRRKERRAAKKGGGGIYSGAYQRRTSNSGYAYPVTKASYEQAPTAPEFAPDLTLTEISVEGDALCVTVKNVGHAPSPETRLEVALMELTSDSIEAQNVRVLPLQPNQSVRIRIRSIPVSNIAVSALVDPDYLVAEYNKNNNDLQLTRPDESQAGSWPTLADESTWNSAAH